MNENEASSDATRDSFVDLVDSRPNSGSGQRLLEALPGWAAEYCATLEDKLEIPGDMLATALVGAISGTISGHIEGDARGGRVSAVLQVMIAGSSSSGKTRTLEAITGPLRDMQRQAEAEGRRQWTGYNRPRIILLEQQIKELRSEMDGSPSDGEAAMRIARCEAEIALLNVRPHDKEHYIMDNTTGPARNMILATAHRNAAFFLTPDARANVRVMLDGRPAEREAEIAQMLKGFSGDPLDVGRVTERLRREAPQQWLAVLMGIQPDLARQFWANPLLRCAGLHSRVQAFHYNASGTSGMRYPDDDVRRVEAVFHRYLTALDALKRAHLDGPPVTIPFTQGALEKLNGTRHPFRGVHAGEGSLQAALLSRWQQETVPRWALVIAMLRYDGGELPEVTADDIDSACSFVFRAHRDAVELAGVSARNADEVAHGNLVRHLRDNGGRMPLASGNPLGLSIVSLERLVNSRPEELRIGPVSNGGRGRPQKHVLLNA